MVSILQSTPWHVNNLAFGQKRWFQSDLPLLFIYRPFLTENESSLLQLETQSREDGWTVRGHCSVITVRPAPLHRGIIRWCVNGCNLTRALHFLLQYKTNGRFVEFNCTAYKGSLSFTFIRSMPELKVRYS